MSKRARTLALTLFVLGFLLWGLGWPMLKIYLNLTTGSRVQEALIDSLRKKYPDQVFKKGGVGYMGPSVGIRVSSPVDPARVKEILRFVEAELEHWKFGVDTILYFTVEKKCFILFKSSKQSADWEEQ